MNIFYEITKQKFLEAVYAKQYLVAVDICRDEMRVFKDSHKDAVPSLMHLMTDEAFRDFRKSQEAQGARVPDLSHLMFQVNAPEKSKEEESPLQNFDIESSRARLCNMLKQSVDRGKCFLHPLESSRLKVLCKQNREWQHSQCQTKIHDLCNSSVGTLDGSLFLRKLGNHSGDRTISFSVWNPSSYSRDFLATSNQCSVTCIRWSPCGSFIALGFSKNLVQLYSFQDCADLRSLVVIEAHSGSVNDISILAERSIIITCGQYCLIKIWNLNDGENQEILRGHINSVACLSVSLEGPKLLIYSVDDRGMSGGKDFEVASINYDGCVIHDIVSNLDGSIILSSGLDQEDYLCLTEWSYNKESTSMFCKRTYLGLTKKFQGEVNFDFKSRLLVASNDGSIHFWNPDDDICL